MASTPWKKAKVHVKACKLPDPQVGNAHAGHERAVGLLVDATTDVDEEVRHAALRPLPRAVESVSGGSSGDRDSEQMNNAGNNLLASTARTQLVCRYMLVLFCLMNLIALAWCALGERDGTTWMTQWRFESNTIVQKYILALHWVVCQLTFANMEVVPVNAAERLFSISLSLFSFLTIYPLIGNVVLLLSDFWAFARGGKAREEMLTFSTMCRQVVSLLLIIIVLTLFLAIGWFALGETGHNTWMVAARLHESADGVHLRFLAALHWAICQYTPAITDLRPVTSIERVYATCVPIFALVTLYPLVGGMIIWLDRLRVRTALLVPCVKKQPMDSEDNCASPS